MTLGPGASYRQHGTGGCPPHVLGDAAEQEMGHAAAAMWAHDDAIDGTSKRFLAGTVRSRRQWTQEIRFIASRYLDGRAGWGHDFGDAARDEIAVGVDAGW